MQTRRRVKGTNNGLLNHRGIVDKLQRDLFILLVYILHKTNTLSDNSLAHHHHHHMASDYADQGNITEIKRHD